jgi:serine/threonine-protein kinase mTOR
MTALEMKHVSPRLEKLENLTLAVPGTYVPGQKDMVTIHKFCQKISVIQSKQRPRRLSIRGSDGRDYEYNLKGIMNDYI